MRIDKLILMMGIILIPFVGFSVSAQDELDSTEPSYDLFQRVDTFTDWEKLCLKLKNGSDACHMYQLIKDADGHPTGAMTLHRTEQEEGISAAATILTPLETFLPSGLLFSIDGATPSEFPFSWCDTRGCFVNVAFTDDDIFSMKHGRKGAITIESITAPGKPIRLPVSFSGFTAAFGSLE